MKKLISLPPHLANDFNSLTGLNSDEWFSASDPVGKRVGSGGGTAWLLQQWEERGGYKNGDRCIMVHACGQSRRLPSYAALSKALTPVPVFRWALGQSVAQTLLSLQMPLYEEIMDKAPNRLKALIASGDVYIHTNTPVEAVPDADVVCFGLWADATLASHHGVFVIDRNNTDALDFMLQKPSVEQLSQLAETHYFLMDIGLWLLSEKAINLLKKRSHTPDGEICYYDLYSDFGCALGKNPSSLDDEINSLSVAIQPLKGGEFYHFGTSAELISSTLALQSKVADQRHILHRKIKPSPALFTQNSIMGYRLTAANENVWVENSFIPSTWTLNSRHVITGVPENDWSLEIPSDICLDIVPIGDSQYAVRPYGYTDAMRGDINAESTTWMGIPSPEWLRLRGISIPSSDIQNAPIFPIVSAGQNMADVIRWMISDPKNLQGKEIWQNAQRISADEITASANLKRLLSQRERFQAANIEGMGSNYEKSVFYQLDLADLSERMNRIGVPAPSPVADTADPITRMRSFMLRSRLTGNTDEEKKAFYVLRSSILAETNQTKSSPRMGVHSDQIVWARTPLRIDLAGGWTDTPPYSISTGGNVVNLAVELNGQPPIQTFVKPCREPHIVIRSIDMGASEIITDYDELTQFHRVGSPFSIPKAALALAGFAPGFSEHNYPTLRQQLQDFGSGIEITLLSAVPAGSGLGTSSILAATVLGALSDFCSLAWDATETCNKTLALEQLLTTGGGWQDQYGGVLRGVKLLQTAPGLNQTPLSRWLPGDIFTDTETQRCHLLYYTGITRTAKNILSEIVRGMFLNSGAHLRLLDDMKYHAIDMNDAIQRGDFTRFGHLVGRSWMLNKKLDAGTNPPAVEAIIRQIEDYTLGLKLPGAGGGGFLYMVAKDPEAAARIRETLSANTPNPRARFVEMNLSSTGLRISRS